MNCAHVDGYIARESAMPRRSSAVGQTATHEQVLGANATENRRVAKHTQSRHARSVMPNWDHCASWSLQVVTCGRGEKFGRDLEFFREEEEEEEDRSLAARDAVEAQTGARERQNRTKCKVKSAKWNVQRSLNSLGKESVKELA